MIFDFPTRNEAVTESRKLASALNVGENRVLCRVLGRWKMFLDARDTALLPHLALDGLHEPWLSEVICGLVKPGMTCVDVGACFGYQTMLLAEKVGEQGRVFAFEPNPRVFPMLKENLKLNGYERRVRPHPTALGDSSGIGELALFKRRFDGATLSEKAKVHYGASEAAGVNIARLDDVLGAHRVAPDFYLIAAEGYEPQVWAGMREALQATRKVTVLLEFNPRWYADAEEFLAEIYNAGFGVMRIAEDCVVPVKCAADILGNFKSELVLAR